MNPLCHPQKAPADTVTGLLTHNRDSSEVLLKDPGPVWGMNFREENPHHLQHKVRVKTQSSSLILRCLLLGASLPRERRALHNTASLSALLPVASNNVT